MKGFRKPSWLVLLKPSTFQKRPVFSLDGILGDLALVFWNILSGKSCLWFFLNACGLGPHFIRFDQVVYANKVTYSEHLL